MACFRRDAGRRSRRVAGEGGGSTWGLMDTEIYTAQVKVSSVQCKGEGDVCATARNAIKVGAYREQLLVHQHARRANLVCHPRSCQVEEIFSKANLFWIGSGVLVPNAFFPSSKGESWPDLAYSTLNSAKTQDRFGRAESDAPRAASPLIYTPPVRAAYRAALPHCRFPRLPHRTRRMSWLFGA